MGENAPWSCGRAIDADACVFGDKLILYFATRDKSFERQMVGVASVKLDSGFRAGNFEIYGEPVLVPALDWEKTRIETPAVLARDGKVYPFYAGAYNCAVSDNGFRFKRLHTDKPLLSNGAPGEWNASESGHPYIYTSDEGRLWLYYQSSPDTGKSR